MLTVERLKELRIRAKLRQEDLAQFFGVGIATIIRWEKPVGATLPSGLPRQLYEVMDILDRAGVDLSPLEWTLRMHGNVAAVSWLLNTYNGRAKGM